MLPCAKAVRLLLFLSIILIGSLLHAESNPDWTTPQPPFRIADNLYYVGSRDLAAYLVVTPAGNILINSNLESSPPQIRASVQRLGFRWADTRILLNSQAHFDHVAGTAAVVQQTGAKVMVMDGDASVMESGGHSDFDKLPTFPPAHVDHVLHDEEEVRLGDTVLTAHKTAGHTRGCTSWSMKVHLGTQIRTIVIAGGFLALDDYRLIDKPGRPASYPGIAQDFSRGFAVLRSLPCDIFLGAHGVYFNMQQKLANLLKSGSAVWIDPQGYQRAITEAEMKFHQHLAHDQASNVPIWR